MGGRAPSTVETKLAPVRALTDHAVFRNNVRSRTTEGSAPSIGEALLLDRFVHSTPAPIARNRGETLLFAANAERVVPGTWRPLSKSRQLRRSEGEDAMTSGVYDKDITALVVIDPYNDFISEGGKVWGRLRAVAEANGCVPHMLQILNAARAAKFRVFYAMHHRYRPGDYETWKYVAPIQRAAWERKTFEYGTWGGEFKAGFEPKPGEIVAAEHWCSSGFANTDLDLQLKKHGIHKLIIMGLIAHTCVEATVRYAAELGYAFERKQMR